MKLRFWDGEKLYAIEGENRIHELELRILNLEGALNVHSRTELTKAHPRTGDVEQVKKYLGLD